MQPVEELSGGAGAEASAVGVGQDLLERALERDRIGDTGQRADGSAFRGLPLVVVAEALAAEGGAAATASIGVPESAPGGCHRQAEPGAGNVGRVRDELRTRRDGLDPGGGGGGIDSRDSRI